MPSKRIPIYMRTHGDIEVFLFHFADFADFEDFNWSVLHEGAVCSWSLYGMNYRPNPALECCSNRFQFTWEHMELLRFSILILLILLILRISTGQDFMKERSVHEVCMGWIIEQIGRLNFVETDSDLHENSWSYWGFPFQFWWFWWFSGFQLVTTSWRNGLFMKFVWDEL